MNIDTLSNSSVPIRDLTIILWKVLAYVFKKKPELARIEFCKTWSFND